MISKNLYYSTGFTRTIFTVCLFNHLVSKLLSQKTQYVFVVQCILNRIASVEKNLPDIYYF